MDVVKDMITVNLDKYPHFEEYFKIIEIIEDNEDINPDICIESCKALIEGISKTIIVSLDNTKNYSNIDDDNLPRLFKDAMNLLSTECVDIEGDFVVRFSSIIQILGEIRNKRGDISHGRLAPKVVFSSPKLSTTFKNMTASMLEYILQHYFEIDFSSRIKLNYYDESLKEYNDWLDDSVDFPIKKAVYSQLLYENDYDEYENRYNDEYLKSIEPDEIESESEKVIDEDEKSLQESKVKPEVDDKPVETLVNEFFEDSFWTEARLDILTTFAESYGFNYDETKLLIEDFLFSDKDPLPDEAVKVYTEKPGLKERKEKVEFAVSRIKMIAGHLKIN